LEVFVSSWALDLGTTHTRIARWDPAQGEPRLLELPGVCRESDGDDPLEAPRLVPSAIHVLDNQSFLDRAGNWPFLRRHFFFGRRALIGRPALAENAAKVHANFVPSWKLALLSEPLRPLISANGSRYNAREVARLFLHELLGEIHRVTDHRIREAVLTAPVDAYETYRAELARISREVGIRRVRFLDEPVAAALGYGLGLTQDRLVLVMDFGGGTLHLAVATLTARDAEKGRSRIIAKAARSIGGRLVDRWVLEEVGQQLGFPLRGENPGDEAQFWYRQMLAEAQRVKETVFFNSAAVFRLTPPDFLRRPVPGAAKTAMKVEITKDGLVDILKKNGLYRALGECLEELDEQCRAQNIPLNAVQEILMVGGSTLLPGVYPLFEERFGRDRVRAWRPFEAVAFGASVFASGSVTQTDFIMHDYAILTHDPKTHAPQHHVIVPKGTRFPTPKDFWKRRLVPTCSLGEPETIFKLVICEIGRGDGLRQFGWDAGGELKKLGGAGGEKKLVVPLNESNPTLGRLDPPHSPSDRRPRLEVGFGVNEDRWLCADVLDLQTRRFLLRNEPVVRLM
jgi:molecular chaperone DnaK (HSP70)